MPAHSIVTSVDGSKVHEWCWDVDEVLALLCEQLDYRELALPTFDSRQPTQIDFKVLWNTNPNSLSLRAKCQLQKQY